MNNVFFYYLVPLEDSLGLLDSVELSEKEKNKLQDIIHSMYEHRITEVILTNLPTDIHEHFVKRVSENPYDLEIMSFLKSKNSDIDSIIQYEGKNLHNEIIALLAV